LKIRANSDNHLFDRTEQLKRRDRSEMSLMEINKKAWPIASVFGIRGRIDTNPDFQRPPVWSRAQKQLLIDSIIRGYDVPKFYWRLVGKNPDHYEVVDGQQRLRAIWEFYEGEYPLPKDADPVNGFRVASLKYTELPDDLRIACDTYNLDVIVLQETDDDEVREMFLRLQNGTSLKAQEKRNAMPGNMREYVHQLTLHPFFGVCAFANSRYAHDHIAAQMILLELNGRPCNLRNADLNKMYEDNLDFDLNGAKAKKCRRVLDYLFAAFPNKTPELERFNVVSLYGIVSNLLERYVMRDRSADLAKWFLRFEQYGRSQDELPADKADPEMVVYHEKISHSTDAVDSILWRHEFLLRKLFEAVPDIEQKDDQRIFAHEQRLAIYRRDDGYCRVKIRCDGKRCDWDDWAADHINPWSRGGKTTVANGQVACIPCNSAKGDAVQPDAAG
jgi:hypothetical protein